MNSDEHSKKMLVIGLLLVIGVFSVCGVIYYKFDKAAVYTCYYGVPDRQLNSIDQVQGGIPRVAGVDDLKCFKGSGDGFVCPEGFESTKFSGYFYMTEKEYRDINCVRGCNQSVSAQDLINEANPLLTVMDYNGYN